MIGRAKAGSSSESCDTTGEDGLGPAGESRYGVDNGSGHPWWCRYRMCGGSSV